MGLRPLLELTTDPQTPSISSSRENDFRGHTLWHHIPSLPKFCPSQIVLPNFQEFLELATLISAGVSHSITRFPIATVRVQGVGLPEPGWEIPGDLGMETGKDRDQ